MKIRDLPCGVRISSWVKQHRGAIRIPRSPNVASRGKAAIFYTSSPFRSRRLSHSNVGEARTMADLLANAGWDLDIIDYDSKRAVNSNDYGLALGFGDQFERFCMEGRPHQRRIFYSTGAYQPYQNTAELARVADFQKRHGVRLKARRCLDRNWPASCILSDQILLIGNEWTLSTYPTHKAPTRLIRPTTNAHWIGPRQSPPGERRGVLWLGSAGHLHKGLDLILDSLHLITGRFELHICGDNDKAEPDFWSQYTQLPANVHRHGFLDLASEAMRAILDACTFVVLPSCSEGTATSVLAGMASGLIPIVSAQAGVDVRGCGLHIRDLTPHAVAQAINEGFAIPDRELVRLGTAAHRQIEDLHTIEAYRQQLSSILASLDLMPPLNPRLPALDASHE